MDVIGVAKPWGQRWSVSRGRIDVTDRVSVAQCDHAKTGGRQTLSVAMEAEENSVHTIPGGIDDTLTLHNAVNPGRG